MQIIHIIKSIVSGDIGIDFKGHNFDKDYINESLLKTLEKYEKLLEKRKKEFSDLSLVKSYKNNGFVKPEDFENTFLYDFYILRSMLFNTTKKDTLIIDLSKIFCSKCEMDPKEIHINLLTEKAELFSFEEIEPAVYEYHIGTNRVKSIIDEGKWAYAPMPKCEVENFTSINEIINVDNNLIFRNFFLDENGEYLKDNLVSSINYLGEVKKLAGFYADENILYGQTGNMSVYIYKKGTQLVILSSNVSDMIEEIEEYNLSDLKKEQLETYSKWDYIGSISCEVWRYMATSESTIKRLNLKKDHYDDEVNVELPSGKYEMKHNYRITDKGLIVSTITKI